MPKISSNLGSWSTRIYETIRGTNPISIFNRICIADRTCFFDRVWNVDNSKTVLREKIQVCREKAGIRGEKYSPDLELWKSEVIGLSRGVQQNADTRKGKTLPTQASPKNELIYNHELAKAATDQELDTLSQNVSTYSTLIFLHNQLGPGPEVDSSILFDIIAQNEKNPQKDVLKMYIDHFSPKIFFFWHHFRSYPYNFSKYARRASSINQWKDRSYFREPSGSSREVFKRLPRRKVIRGLHR